MQPTTNNTQLKTILVAGAGLMGTGIAQIAAQAGHPVMLFDVVPGAASKAKTRLASTLDGLAQKGKIDAVTATKTMSRIVTIEDLELHSRSADVVIEAIVERLDAKRELLKQLEQWVKPDVVLATNTSSISVTAIANGLERPGRVVGMHFFNPVPVMKLVEVVSGLLTDPMHAQAVHELARSWGKIPVHTKSTPGFIVNRVARPYYAEALALLQEQAATPITIDACLRAAGFRMGPCELMDLIGHDTNFAVTQSVYEANFQDKRFVPSLIQREMVEGGLLGRKSGHGFYSYPDGMPQLPVAATLAAPQAKWVVVHGDDHFADWAEPRLAEIAASSNLFRVARERSSSWTGLSVDGARLQVTDGRPAFEIASVGSDDIAVFDRLPSYALEPGQPLAFALHARASTAWTKLAPAWLQLLGFRPVEMADVPGLIVGRTTAMLINEAADAVLQGVCGTQGADEAMKLGANYPAGPFDWLRGWDRHSVAGLIDALDATYRGERYRVSPWLRRPQEI